MSIDLIIDYICDYTSEDYYEEAVLEEEKKQLYDVLITCLSKGKNAYDTTYEYIETYTVLIGDAGETLVNMLLIKIDSKNVRAAVVIALRDIALLESGTDKDLKQLYSIYCYSSMTYMYVEMLSWSLQPGMNNGYYSCYKKCWIFDSLYKKYCAIAYSG